MNDLELVDLYCETCLRFINPFTFREIEKRGLYWVINKLPSNTEEAKTVARGRFASVNRIFGDPEIDHIANQIKRLESLRKQLMDLNMADAHKVSPILKEMAGITNFLLDYYK